MLIVKLVGGIVYALVIFALLLFVPAGTIHWPRAWVFLGVVAVANTITMFGVFHRNEALLNERYKSPVQKGQPLADKIVLLLFVAAFTGAIVLIPLDVFRFHLMAAPDPLVSSFGLILFVAGWTLITLAFKENAFAAPVVKHQEERQQMVIDTGLYRIVRHPMYSAAVLLLLGVALWLESYAAALFAIVPIVLLAVRILFEEQFLRRELRGYDEYTRKVRYRLIPFLW
jgi:protein-S-isoprenylcysteine O-methyltransferase Ste14